MSEDPLASIERLLEANNAEIDRLLTALAFYAKREHYEDGQPDCWDPEEDCSDPCSILEDGGLIARQALGSPEPERVVWTPPSPPDPPQRAVPTETEENRLIRERMAKFLETVDARA